MICVRHGSFSLMKRNRYQIRLLSGNMLPTEILVPSDPIICEPESGTFSFDVSANISYDVTTDVSWLKQVVGRGMEQSTLHFSVEENTGSAMREGNIILSGNGVERTVKVMQKGKEERLFSRITRAF